MRVLRHRAVLSQIHPTAKSNLPERALGCGESLGLLERLQLMIA